MLNKHCQIGYAQTLGFTGIHNVNWAWEPWFGMVVKAHDKNISTIPHMGVSKIILTQHELIQTIGFSKLGEILQVGHLF